MKTVITAQELLEIHKIACDAWKSKIKKYFLRINNYQLVSFLQEEINEMFNDSNSEQKPVLEKIFGKQVKPIEWDRIKTGSRVMISNTINLNINEAVDVIFFDKPYYIDNNNEFYKKIDNYCTFHQDGRFTAFSSESYTDYITEVIEY
jgi:hypothetical protein